MEIQSRHLADVASGVELHTTLDGESISVYVVTGVTDLNAIAEIVPARSRGRSGHTRSQCRQY